MKRLLIATDSFLPRWDGISRFLSELLPELAKHYETTVIAPQFEGKFIAPKGVRVVRIPLSRFVLGDYRSPQFKSSIIRKEVENADILFSQTIGPIGALSIFEASKKKKPIIAYIHSIEWELFTFSLNPKPLARQMLHSISKIIARVVYNKCSLLLVPSREIGEFITLNGIKTQKKVLHMGTDVHKFAPTHDKSAAKKSLGLNPNAQVIGYLGRLGREKDLQTLYRAFLRLQKHFPDAQLLVVGEGIAEVKKFFEAKKGIFLAGQQDDTVPYYQAMDVYVLPSLTETSSLSTIEAMSCGVPVVCTPVGYVRVYVRNGFNGYLFPRRNSFALAHRLKALLSNAPLREKLGKNARRTAITQFSWDRTVREMKQVLEFF
ncbi:MAG: glycosyltransferase family 1 protein [Nanoarchaeota archaeon]|nr:MAG: glycosyltransferase family 1 protein [Nanoarchaeota archaeon]